MRIYKPRGLNVDESYACSRTALRKCFGEWDISVFWGEPADYAFDRAIRRPPEIDGCVVASMQLNFRRRTQARAALRFYLIRDSRYDKGRQGFFEEKLLPRMHDWLSARRENPPQSGVEELLVLWNGEDFALQELRYA